MNIVSKNHRPYIKLRFDGLFEVAENNWNNINVLQELNEELNYRTNSNSLDLRIQVIDRLDWLKSQIYVHRSRDKIKCNNPDYFPWVSTEIGYSFEKMDTSSWKKNDLLSELGYKTGNYSDLDAQARREILDRAYQKEIPKRVAILFEDIENWGEPNSPTRLRKIAESIALVVRSEKMHSYNYEISIAHRESDLAYLKKEFYNDNYDKQYFFR